MRCEAACSVRSEAVALYDESSSSKNGAMIRKVIAGFMDSPSMEDKLRRNQRPILLIRLMSRRRTWVFLFVVVYGVIVYSSWNLLRSILGWYRSTASFWSAVYASAMLGAVFGLVSMAAAAGVAVPAMLVTWITVLVLLAFCGRRRRDLVVEGKKLTGDITRFVVKILVKEGNLVAAVCAVLGYFFLVRKGVENGLNL